MATANIYDVSDCNSTYGYETTIDWIEDTRDNADGYIIKLGETLSGVPTLDDNFVENVNAAVKHNKPFGIYYVNHFLDDSIPEKEEDKEEIVAIKKGIVSLLRDRITQSCRHIENNGFITQQQITSITDLYDSYKNLGGNHGLNIIVEKTIKLPIKQ